jgi:hypothetical protein
MSTMGGTQTLIRARDHRNLQPAVALSGTWTVGAVDIHRHDLRVSAPPTLLEDR